MLIIDQESPQLQAGILHLSGSEASGLLYKELLCAGGGCTARNRPWLVATNGDLGAAVAFRPTCKSWNCPACGDVNRKRWIATALHGVEELRAAGHQVDFLTITSHEKLSAAASFRVFPLAWPKLRFRYYRAVPAADPRAFLAVPERHKDGRLHAHAIITGGLPTRWWKDNARECGLGYKAEATEVVDLGVAGYVSKYLGKTLTERWPKHKRRVNTSQTWPKLPDLPHAPGWMFRPVPPGRELSGVLANFIQMGYETVLATAEGSWGVLDALSADQMLRATSDQEMQ